jgi:hypothetical protein
MICGIFHKWNEKIQEEGGRRVLLTHALPEQEFV